MDCKLVWFILHGRTLFVALKQVLTFDGIFNVLLFKHLELL